MSDEYVRIRVIGGPWPERIGSLGYIVPEPYGPKQYPWASLGSDVVVRLDGDTTEREGQPNWTCCIGRADVQVFK